MSDKNNPSVTDKMTQLEALVSWFDGEEFELEEALGKFNEAKSLADEIERDLMDLKNTITVINQKFDRDEA